MPQLDDRRFNRLALFALAAGFGLALVAFASIVLSAIGNDRAAGSVQRTYQVTEQLAQMNLAIERTETALRGYLLAPHPRRLKIFTDNRAQVGPRLRRLSALVQDNPRQRQALAVLVPKIVDQIAADTDMMTKAVDGGLDEARMEFVRRVKVRQIEQIRAIGSAIRAEELRLLSARQADEARQRSQLQWVLAATGLLLLALGAATFWLVRRYTNDLTAARDRLNILNTDLESQVRERTADLIRANEEVQRFAYIVSHDLRSPLVNVMGFTAELETTSATLERLIERAEAEAPQIVDQDTRHAKEDLPEAIGFIRSSTQKMDRLINAILKLSRQGQRTLVPEHLPMSRLLAEVSQSLEHALTAKGATLTIDPALPDIVNDRLAIEQIFSNLLDNAVKYLDPGRPGDIRVHGRRQGDCAVYEVTDNGRGIGEGDLERVFDLFRRAGRQDQEGEGIGLAHVRALTHRLGGRIDLESRLGVGTTFRLHLPATLESGATQ